MLVLSRKRGEYIQIGPHIRVHVLAFGTGGKVQVGIEAPSDVRITLPEVKVKEPK